MRILVIGAGAMGSLFGGLLSRKHEVTLVARSGRAAAIRAEGYRIETGEDSLLVRPNAAERIPAGSFDVAAFAVKAYDLHAACAEYVSAGPEARWVLCLQNGIGNEEILRARFNPERIVRGLVYHGVSGRAPGRVLWYGRGYTLIGRPLAKGAKGNDPEIEGLAREFSEAGFPVRPAADIRAEIWKKLAVNAAINPLGAVTGLPNGALVRSPFLLSILSAAVLETQRTARAEEGHVFDAVDRTIEIALVTGRNRNSMLVDIDAGRPTEIDFLSGAVVRLATRHGIPVPVSRTLHALVRGKEEALRGSPAEGE
jgi:2-dehydropantoate 2-reductase